MTGERIYKILGISRYTDKKEAERRYKELCKRYHPDNIVTGNSEKFQEVYTAWKELISRENAFGLSGTMITHKTLFKVKRRKTK